ncbi:MAG: HAMP domain-containing protein [Actinobacteria bacterium]|uniref:histidine kinase n=1 Tax=freshwater metagenome TaxID=449393 RepID=A0A6J7C2E5_9ZZZZ|nr:HAMP domain-containing protein [Actinomycetota bacterium]MSW76722.1 HAMP domain-containing protein [Actinomycetota bacterium]MSX55350.1 HAMP domain-containing protein [Actinomycetota bacterium]MSX92435.1 HAMP domain-containing protein [Actinomycetota bacterium]MSZ82169.1 HAMP domain-containing protein [Actinomycetota bacterium]
MSLRLRLTLGIALVLAVSLGLLGYGVVQSTRADALAIVRRQVERSLSVRANSPPPPVGTDRPDSDTRGRATAHFVIAADGTIRVTEPAGPPSDPTPVPHLSAADIARLQSGDAVTVDAVDGSLRYLVLAERTSTGDYEVQAGPLVDIDATIDSLVRRLLAGALITLVLAAAAVIAVLRHGLKPLRKVIATADAVAAGERELRIPTDEGPTEIRHLAAALDHMLQNQRTALQSKEESEQRLRHFISDASHELQTPITSVLGWVELHRKGALDAAGSVAAMERIEAESRRMSALVDELLLLARLDEQRPLQLAPTDLSAIAADAVTDASAVEPTRPITLEVSGAVMVMGDAARLRQVIDNLLRNVRVHTPTGAAATVRVSIEGSTAVVTVCDSGPGIDSESLPHVFDRFWRRDYSRTRATGGAGLGLAIVAALVAAHGGSVSAANLSSGGAAFTCALPLAEPIAP